MTIRNGDLFGTPPSGFWAKLACKIVKAHTFHWGFIIGQDKEGYITSESLGKGTSVSRLVYPKAYIYRIKNLKHEPETFKLVSYHSQYGDTVYDMQVNFLTAIWFILKHYFKKVIPVIKNHTFNCQEWCVYLAWCLGYRIIPENEYPYCVNLEKSADLEFIGTWENGNFLGTNTDKV